MTWLPLALAGPALLTVINFIDKYIIEREVPDHKAMPIFAGVFGFLAALVFQLLGLGSMPTTDEWVVLLGAGVLVIVGAAFYFRAISLEQTSTVILLAQTTPIVILILSGLILRETISGMQLVGFFIILGAAIGISIQPGMGKFKISLTLWLMLAVSLSVAVRTIMVGSLTTTPDFATLIIYLGYGQGLGALLVYVSIASYRQAFNRSIVEMRKFGIAALGVNEVMFLIAGGMINQANTMGNVALVNVLMGTQAFYGILLGWLLTVLAPKIFQEKIERKDLLRKIILAAVLMVGLAFVVLGNAA